MENISPVQVTDLRQQVDHKTPRNFQLFEEYRNEPNNARLLVILIPQTEIEMIPDIDKITKIPVILGKKQKLFLGISRKRLN